MIKNDHFDNMKPEDEISLIDLILVAWEKKIIILVASIGFFISSIIYALNAQEKWESKAEITAPNIKEMGNFLDTYEKFHVIIDQSQTSAHHSDKSSQKPLILAQQNTPQSQIVSKTLFDNFSSAIGSNEKQVNFFKQSKLLQKSIDNGNSSNVALLRLITGIHVEKPNEENKDIKHISVSFQANNAELAKSTLNNLVKFINVEVRQTMTDELITEIKTKIKTLKIQKESIKSFADTALEVRLKNLKKAASIAKKAGIKEYSQTREDGLIQTRNQGSEAGIQLVDSPLAEDGFLFILGEKYLNAQIDVLLNTEVIYPEDYYHTALKIQLLEEILNNKEHFKFNTYHYQSAPSLPLFRVAPKKGLIVLASTIFGALIGFIIALLAHAIKRHKTQQRATL